MIFLVFQNIRTQGFFSALEAQTPREEKTNPEVVYPGKSGADYAACSRQDKHITSLKEKKCK
jgi:hypothetical protein